jgi:hypothetical protein
MMRSTGDVGFLCPRSAEFAQQVDLVPVDRKTAIPDKRREARIARVGMKRYLIFAALGPFLGGFLLLVATTVASGYWHQTDLSGVAKLFVVFLKTLQYSYLFGVLPALMISAVDDILFHVPRIGWVVRMLIVGAIAFFATELLYGSRGPDSGITQFFLYGLVGFVPSTISSWLAHKAIEPQPLPSSGLS